jgi:arylsulfatase A-like enzyme
MSTPATPLQDVLGRRPNLLLLITDEQRYPTPYESDELAGFRRNHLVAQESLREHAVEFHRHYTMSTACAPARASFLTGQYPSLHGVTQTDGMAKRAWDRDMFWLGEDTVATLGDWFRAAGYRTFWKGKWHVSSADLERPNHRAVPTLTRDGEVLDENVRAYLRSDRLDAHGFSEWVGPEPHGLPKENTGSMRDPLTAAQTVDLLERLDADADDAPWLVVSSFVNPHDIVLFGLPWISFRLPFADDRVPAVARAPTQREDLATKPRCQRSYVDTWWKMLLPQPMVAAQRRLYYHLHRLVDEEIARVVAKLEATRFHETTIVIFLSDHGDMLGAHGGMHQKWHNAYEESVRVPFLFSNPVLFDGHTDHSALTSHADLLPTLLGLAGIDAASTLEQVGRVHSETRPLVGRDLSDLVLGHAPSPRDPVLFTTDDEISEGRSPQSPYARIRGRYSPVIQPNHIECVLAEREVDGEPHVLKFSRYHDNPQFWSHPGERDEVIGGGRGPAGFRTRPEPDEFELYDLTADPLERSNLADPQIGGDAGTRLQHEMLAVLRSQLAEKRLIPRDGGPPGYRPIAG